MFITKFTITSHLSLQQLHYLHEETSLRSKKRFVFFCSECECILSSSRSLKPVNDVIEIFENRCPNRKCDSILERSIVCKSSYIAETWADTTPSNYTRRQITHKRKALFQLASELRGFSFNFAPLDRLVYHLKPGWLAAFTGPHAEKAAELLCFRAELPKERGGLDSNVVFVDGGNCSDLYLFSSYARQYGVHPKQALRRVATSRAFTIHQLANLIMKKLPNVIDDYGAKLVIIADVLSMFNEPELDSEETRRLINEIKEDLHKISRTKDVLLLATFTTRTQYDHMITDCADLVLKLDQAGPRIRANLLKHPFREPNFSEFSLQDLLRPVPFRNEMIQHGKNATLI